MALFALDFLVTAAFFAAVERFADVDFRLVDFLALAAFFALDFLVAAPFFAAVERLVALAFLVVAPFLAAVDRFADVDFRLVDFFALAAFFALDFLVAAPFLAAVERLVALAFLVRAAFFAAVERLLDVDFLDDFFAGAMTASFSRGDLSPLVIAIRTILKLAVPSPRQFVRVEGDVMTTLRTSRAGRQSRPPPRNLLIPGWPSRAGSSQ